MATITTEQAWDLIESTNGKIFGAKAVKRTDGTMRTFNCRLARTTKVGKVGGKLGYHPGQKNLVAVFEVAADREASDKYRMINMEGLLEVSVGGERFDVSDE